MLNRNNMIQLLVNSMPGVVFWKSLNLHYLGANQQFLNFLGLNNISQLIGKRDAELNCSTQKIDYLNRFDLLILQTEQPQYAIQDSFLQTDGSLITLITDKHPFYDDDNNLIGILCISSVQNNNRVSVQTYLENIIGMVIDRIPYYIFWKDAKSVYLGCNKNFSNLVNKTPQEVIGKTDFELGWKAGEAEIFVDGDRETMLGRLKVNVEETLLQPDGSQAIMLVSKVPILDNKQCIGILGISIDITERKKIEDDLRKAKIAAEAASRAKSEFIANMSHDIRTPLTGIIGMSQAIEDKAQDIEEKKYAQMLHESGEQLLNLLNGVLEVISTDELHEINLQEDTFSLHKCIEDICKLELPTIKHKKLDLRINIDKNIPSCVISDESKLHRILLNLVGNAIKFTESGYISILVTLLEQKNNRVQLRFSVHDTGIGINKEAQDKLFERFYRINPSYKGIYEGYGIGLHIAQKYTESLGGKIKFSSDLNKGTTFYFDLWLKIGKETDIKNINFPKLLQIQKKSASLLQSLSNTTLAKMDSNSPHLLLVEDNKPALIALENNVRQAGCRFTSAMDGEQALNLVTNHNFDLIITDIGLPGMSGLELSQYIREWENNNQKKPTPIVALTGHAKEEIETQDTQSCINTVLAKPMRTETLKALLDEYILEEDEFKNSVVATPTATDKKLSLPELKSQLFEINQFLLFDMAKGLNFFSGNKEKLDKQLQKLIAFIEDAEIMIKKEMALPNWRAVGDKADKIRELAACCGVIKLEYASYYVEYYSKEKAHFSLLEKLGEQFESVIQETKQYLKSWLLQENRFLTLPSNSTSPGDRLGRDLPDTEEQLFELEQYPLLDIAKGMETSSISEKELAEFLQLMIVEIANDKKTIQDAYAAKDWDQVEKLAHKAKGGTDYAGTIRMKYACMYLDRYRKAGHSASLETLYQQLIKVLDETQEYIKGWLKQRN